MIHNQKRAKNLLSSESPEDSSTCPTFHPRTGADLRINLEGQWETKIKLIMIALHKSITVTWVYSLEGLDLKEKDRKMSQSQTCLCHPSKCIYYCSQHQQELDCRKHSTFTRGCFLHITQNLENLRSTRLENKNHPMLHHPEIIIQFNIFPSCPVFLCGCI